MMAGKEGRYIDISFWRDPLGFKFGEGLAEAGRTDVHTDVDGERDFRIDQVRLPR